MLLASLSSSFPLDCPFCPATWAQASCSLCASHACRKAVKEQLKSLGVNDQIKSLVAEKRNYKPTKGKEPGITKEQAIEELKVIV